MSAVPLPYFSIAAITWSVEEAGAILHAGRWAYHWTGRDDRMESIQFFVAHHRDVNSTASAGIQTADASALVVVVIDTS